MDEKRKPVREWGPRVERIRVNLLVSLEDLEQALRAVRSAIERWQTEIEEDVIRQDREAGL